MNRKNVIFIDSGIGGISTLTRALNELNFKAIYFADTAFAPYGNKRKQNIQKRLKGVVFELVNTYHPECIVLACNTATTTSIKYLRKHFPTTCFIGTEPAVRLAKMLGFSSPLLIATVQTIRSIKNHKCQLLSMKDLASNIENYLITHSFKSFYSLLKDIFKIKQACKNSDCLVLGCTHYVLIRDLISKYIKQPIIDGNGGVSKQIARMLKQESSKQTPDNHLVIFKFSSKDKVKQEKYKKILNQILAKPINLC